MKSRHRILNVLLLGLIGVLLIYSQTFADEGYQISWFTLSGGGATFLSGGNYTLGGTAGQPDAGTVSGGSYNLQGGFWPGSLQSSTPLPNRVYLPLLQSAPTQ